MDGGKSPNPQSLYFINQNVDFMPTDGWIIYILVILIIRKIKKIMFLSLVTVVTFIM